MTYASGGTESKTDTLQSFTFTTRRTFTPRARTWMRRLIWVFLFLGFGLAGATLLSTGPDISNEEIARRLFSIIGVFTVGPIAILTSMTRPLLHLAIIVFIAGAAWFVTHTWEIVAIVGIYAAFTIFRSVKLAGPTEKSPPFPKDALENLKPGDPGYLSDLDQEVVNIDESVIPFNASRPSKSALPSIAPTETTPGYTPEYTPDETSEHEHDQVANDDLGRDDPYGTHIDDGEADKTFEEIVFEKDGSILNPGRLLDAPEPIEPDSKFYLVAIVCIALGLYWNWPLNDMFSGSGTEPHWMLTAMTLVGFCLLLPVLCIIRALGVDVRSRLPGLAKVADNTIAATRIKRLEQQAEAARKPPPEKRHKRWWQW